MDDEAFLLTGLVAAYYSRKILTISSPCNDSIEHDEDGKGKPEEEGDDREEVNLNVIGGSAQHDDHQLFQNQ